MQAPKTRAPPSFRRAVQLVARAFYSHQCPPPEADPDASKRKPADVTGLGVVVLDALTRREWVKEDALAAELKLNAKALRRALRYLEQEQLVVREHRKEARRQQKRQGEAADPVHGPLSGPEPAVAGDAVAENEDVGRADMHSYCCVDYTRTLDVAALRLFRLRRRLKEQVQDRNALAHKICCLRFAHNSEGVSVMDLARSPVIEYECPVSSGGCGARFNSLQAAELVGADFNFHCEHCNGVLETVLDGAGAGDEKQRRSRLAAMKKLQADAEVQLKPLQAELDNVRGRLAQGALAPDFGTLAEWAQELQDARLRAERGGRGGASEAQGSGMESDQMPSVELELAGTSSDQAATTETHIPKELPPWLRTQAVGNGHTPAGAMPKAATENSALEQETQAAYVKAYLEQVQLRERQLAGNTALVVEPDRKRVKTEHATAAVPGTGLVEVMSKQEAIATGPEIKVEVSSAAAAEEDEVEWEAAEVPRESGGPDTKAAGASGDGSASDVDWEDA